MAIATKPWEKYTPEDDDEPLYDVGLTMREMACVLHKVDIGNTYDNYAVGFSITQKFLRGIQSLVNRQDSRLVEKMMDGPVGMEGQKGE